VSKFHRRVARGCDLWVVLLSHVKALAAAGVLSPSELSATFGEALLGDLGKRDKAEQTRLRRKVASLLESIASAAAVERNERGAGAGGQGQGQGQGEGRKEEREEEEVVSGTGGLLLRRANSSSNPPPRVEASGAVLLQGGRRRNKPSNVTLGSLSSTGLLGLSIGGAEDEIVDLEADFITHTGGGLHQSNSTTLDRTPPASPRASPAPSMGPSLPPHRTLSTASSTASNPDDTPHTSRDRPSAAGHRSTLTTSGAGTGGPRHAPQASAGSVTSIASSSSLSSTGSLARHSSTTPTRTTPKKGRGPLLMRATDDFF
jgi:hypothetical protein